MSPEKQLFGTDGVRGPANRKLTVELAVRLGRAAVEYFRPYASDGHPLFFIGRDPRISGGMIDGALTAGICSAGGDVQRGGILPTPAVSWLTRNYPATAGVVISASHNPVGDNGIKFFDSEGHKLSDTQELAIEEIVLQDNYKFTCPAGSNVGDCLDFSDAADDYYRYIRKLFAGETPLKNLKVVVDCANGAACAFTPALLEELGAEVTSINCHPDGLNINADCGSLHLQSLIDTVRSTNSDVGFAHDGDADRVIFVDEQGLPVDGDHLMALCALEMRNAGTLTGDTVVATVMSNLGFTNFLEGLGINVLRTPVGDRYVLEEMIKGGYKLGGEQSGHIIFYDLNHTGDGIITALQVLKIFAQQQGKFSDLVALFKSYPQKLINVPVIENVPFVEIDGLIARKQELEKEMGAAGRVLLRYSGTEALARVMVEAERQDVVERSAAELAGIIARRIGKE